MGGGEEGEGEGGGEEGGREGGGCDEEEQKEVPRTVCYQLSSAQDHSPPGKIQLSRKIHLRYNIPFQKGFFKLSKIATRYVGETIFARLIKGMV